jgi:hypothetical protein
MFLAQSPGFVAIGHFTNHHHIGFSGQSGADASAHQWVVVCYHDSDGHVSPDRL